MSMNSPTPGPWRVNKYGSVGAGGHGTEPVVANVEPFFGRDVVHGCSSANARLIAAAPDLLAALKCLYTRSVRELADPEDLEEIAMATAAIAKAEGGSIGGSDRVQREGE